MSSSCRQVGASPTGASRTALSTRSVAAVSCSSRGGRSLQKAAPKTAACSSARWRGTSSSSAAGGAGVRAGMRGSWREGQRRRHLAAAAAAAAQRPPPRLPRAPAARAQLRTAPPSCGRISRSSRSARALRPSNSCRASHSVAAGLVEPGRYTCGGRAAAAAAAAAAAVLAAAAAAAAATQGAGLGWRRRAAQLHQCPAAARSSRRITSRPTASRRTASRPHLLQALGHLAQQLVRPCADQPQAVALWRQVHWLVCRLLQPAAIGAHQQQDARPLGGHGVGAAPGQLGGRHVSAGVKLRDAAAEVCAGEAARRRRRVGM